MTVLSVTEMWSRRGGSVNSEQFSPNDQRYALSRGFHVTCEVDDTEAVILADARIPRHGDEHPTRTGAYVTSVQPTPVSQILWSVIVGYEGQTPEIEQIENTVSVEWTDVTTTEPIDRDWDGDAIMTANGEPVEGLTVDIPDQVCVIKRRFATINTYSIAAYRLATNSDEFLGWPPGTARLVGFAASNAFKQGALLERWDVTTRIQFRQPFANTTPAQAWYKRWRHEGLYVKIDGVVQRARDAQGQEVARPVLLNVDGELETDPASALYNHTQVYGSLPYSQLGLL